MSEIDAILALFTESSDLQSVLSEAARPPDELLALLKTPEARALLRARRALARLHTHLLAGRYSPYAIIRLVELLKDDKPDMRLKGALAILGVARLDAAASRAALRAACKKAGEADREPLPEIPELRGTETAELLEAISEVLTRRREDQEKD